MLFGRQLPSLERGRMGDEWQISNYCFIFSDTDLPALRPHIPGVLPFATFFPGFPSFPAWSPHLQTPTISSGCSSLSRAKVPKQMSARRTAPRSNPQQESTDQFLVGVAGLHTSKRGASFSVLVRFSTTLLENNSSSRARLNRIWNQRLCLPRLDRCVPHSPQHSVCQGTKVFSSPLRPQRLSTDR